MFRMAKIPDSCGVSIKPDTVNKHECTVLKRIALLGIECQKVNHRCNIDADRCHWASFTNFCINYIYKNNNKNYINII